MVENICAGGALTSGPEELLRWEFGIDYTVYYICPAHGQRRKVREYMPGSGRVVEGEGVPICHVRALEALEASGKIWTRQ